MRASFIGLTLATLLPGLAFAAGRVKARPGNPEEVWAGYDPRSEPLEVEVVRQWNEAGARYTECYFTGMTGPQGPKDKVRVYAIYSIPEGARMVPAVMHIHGGGQNAYPGWLKYWNERGYAALTYNFSGALPGLKEYTRWGSLTQGNMNQNGPLLMATEPSVRVSSWYLWARIARRALTLLETRPGVDTNRLGIFGISVGGSLVWPVAAMDRRVKAACAIYGAGWTTYPDGTPDPDPSGGDSKMREWRAAMEPEAYAPLVRCPLLFLNATNDHHGKMDFCERSVSAVKGEVRQAYTPRARHHVADEQGRDLPFWMDRWLKNGPAWPRTPRLSLEIGEKGVPVLVAVPDQPGDVARVDIYYGLENWNSKNRFWRSAESRRTDDRWEALAPVFDVASPLFAFANVTYRSGVCLSSRLVANAPGLVGAARATDVAETLIDDFAHGNTGWVTNSTATDPLVPVPELLRVKEGPEHRMGITVTSPIALFTHRIGDPKWRGPAGAALEFKVFTAAPRKIKVAIYEKEFSIGQRRYVREIDVQPAEGWQTFRFPPADFRDDQSQPLTGWGAAQMLELTTAGTGGAEPLYTDFRWVK